MWNCQDNNGDHLANDLNVLDNVAQQVADLSQGKDNKSNTSLAKGCLKKAQSWSNVCLTARPCQDVETSVNMNFHKSLGDVTNDNGGHDAISQIEL